jgi:serine/threonine protein kinase
MHPTGLSLMFFIESSANNSWQPSLYHCSSIWCQASNTKSFDVISAMEYLHSVNVIHNDLKSLNYLVFKDLQVKLTDFGGTLV